MIAALFSLLQMWSAKQRIAKAHARLSAAVTTANPEH